MDRAYGGHSEGLWTLLCHFLFWRLYFFRRFSLIFTLDPTKLAQLRPTRSLRYSP